MSVLRLLSASFLLFAVACGGGSTPRNDVPDAVSGDVEPTDGLEIEEDGLEDAETGPADADAQEDIPGDTPIDGEVEVTPPSPEISFQFLAADGPKGLGEPEVLLVLADEPPAHLETPGFQMDIAVGTKNLENGRDVQLAIAGAVVATDKVVTDATGAGSVLFEGVTFTHLPSGYDVTVSAKNLAGMTGQETKKVLVDIGTCGVDFTPKNTACVLADGNPDMTGVQVTFTITNPDRTCDQATLTYTANGVEQSIGPVVLDASGAATLEVTLLPSADGVDGVPVDVTATVSDSKAAGRAAATPSLAYVVDLIDPVVSIVQPDKPNLSLQDDRDGDPSNGINIDVAGTAAGEAPGGLVTLELNGTIPAAYPPTPPDATGAWLFASLPIVQNGTNTLRAWAQDACGRTGAAEMSLQATVVQTTYSFEFPAQGAVLAAKDDGTPATKMIYESTFVVLADLFQPGTTLGVHCRNQKFGSASFLAGSVRFDTASADGRYAIPVAIDVSATTPKIACQVRDDAVNPGTSSDVQFVAALPAPVLRVLAPKSGAALSKPSLPVALYATSLDGVKPHVRILDASNAEVVAFDAPKGIVQQSASFTVPLDNGGVAIADGSYTLVIDATDSLGNVAADIPGNITAVPFVLDTTAPTVEITNPDHDLLDPAVNEADADQLPDVPGYQTTVSVSVVSGGGEGTQVCLSVNGETALCSKLATGESVQSFPEITLIPGDNSLEAWAIDGSKNAGAHVTRNVNLVLSGPRVTIVTPAKDGPIVALPFDLVVLVTDATKAPLAGAEVTLFRNGVEGTDKVVTGADGKALFSITELSETGDKFVARAVFESQESFSPVRKLFLKTSLPVLTFNVPADQDVVNLAYPACTPGSATCNLDVVVDAINFVEGSSGTLTVVCGSTTKTYPGIVEGASIVFSNVALTDQSTCTLSVAATDVSGQPAEAGPISVRVDRVAPRVPAFLGILASYDYNFDEDPATGGLQKTLTLILGGVEAGQVATIVWGVAGSTDVQSTTFVAPETLKDGTTKTYVLPVMTLPNGTVKITTSIQDQAANLSTSDTYVDVWTDKPSARLFQPAFVDSVACTGAAQCGVGGCFDGKCALPWGIASVRSLSVIVEKAPLLANNLRICTNAAGVTGPTCATGSGFKQIVITTTTGSSTTMSVPLNNLPQGHQSFVAELKGLDGTWFSSMSSAASGDRLRNVFVDTVAPVIGAISSPSDTQEPIGMLNAAEQKAPGRVFEILVQASEAGSLSIEQSGKVLMSLPAFSGEATVDLALSEGANELYAVVADAVGNRSQIWNSTSLLFFRPTVDTILPTLSFLSPGAQVKVGDNADVTLRSDAVGRVVSISEGGIELAQATVVAGQTASFPDATFGLLTNGSHVFDASVSDAAGNPASASVEVLVDREAPAVVVLEPTSNAIFKDADDAQPGVSGFQIEVSFGAVSLDALSWRIEVASDCDAAFEFCGEPTPVASGAVSAAGGIEPSVFPTLGVTASPHYLVVVKAFDAIGNVGWQTIPFSLDLQECTVGLSGFVPNGWINNSACPASGQDCASIARDILVTASPSCGAVTKARLFQLGGTTLVKDFVGQTATFELTLADGSAPSLEGRAYIGDSQVGTSGSQAFNVDLSSPKVQFVKPATADNRFGMAADGNSGTAGLQADLQVTVSDANLANGGTLVSVSWTDVDGTTVLAPSNVALPVAFSASPTTIDLLDVTIPDDSIGTAVVLAKDAAGNFGNATFTAAVDVTAPAPVDLASVTVDNARLPVVTLAWNAPGDDGTAAGTRAASYEIRYSKYPITAENFDSACALDALAASDEVPAPEDAGTAQTFVIRGPDTRNPKTNAACSLVTNMPGAATYSVAIRAVDDMGNRSVLGAASVAAMDIGLRALNVTGTVAPYNDASFQRRVFRVGDLNADGFQDLALGGGSKDMICIVSGWDVQGESSITDYAISASTGTHHQCLTGVSNALGLPIVYLGDVNGDGIDDLGVGEGNRPVDGGVPRMKIWLGVKDGSLAASPNVTIVGMSNAPLAGIVAAGGGNFDGDSVSGRPVNDILIGSKGENKAYVVPGNPAWDAATNVTINLADATDRTNAKVVTIVMTGVEAFTQFGTNATFVKDVSGDGLDEVAISTNYGAKWGGTVSVAGQIVVVKGRTVPAALQITLSKDNTKDPTNGTDDATAARLATTSIVSSLGNASLVGLFDLDGDGKGDVVAGHTPYAVVNLEQTVVGFYGAAIDQSWGSGIRPVGTLAGDAFYRSVEGFSITGAYSIPTPIGNFDDDPASGMDIAYGLYSSSLNLGKVFLRFNQKAEDGGAGPFPFESSVMVDPLDPTGLKFGMALAPVGDFNGDGLPDVAIGTNAGLRATLVY